MNMFWDAFWILFMLGSIVAFIVVAMKDKAARKKAAAALAPAAPMPTVEAEATAGSPDGFGDFPADPMNFEEFK